MERAADSVARDGIGCTSQLEYGLNAAAQTMCRELMEALLTSETATRNDYERLPGERHGGVHKKKVVTLFGPVGPIPRAYYHAKGDKDGGTGRYPWDERMGLVGRHTPAVVSEVLRLAAIHGYEEAAQEFENAHGFRISPDTMRDIVIADAATASEFNLACGHVEQKQRETLAYVLGDGTGISMFRRYLKGVKGKDGKEAKTREVKVAAFFTGSMKKGKPCRDEDSTTYIATTERWEEYGRMSRREFDRRFPLTPTTTIFLSDGSQWLRSVHDNYYPFAIMILDLYHALEHLKEIMQLLGYKEKTDEWTECFRRWKRMFKEGREVCGQGGGGEVCGREARGGGRQEAAVLPRQLRQDEIRRIQPQRMVHWLRGRGERMQVRRPAAPRPVGHALVPQGRGSHSADKDALQVGKARRAAQLAGAEPKSGRCRVTPATACHCINSAGHPVFGAWHSSAKAGTAAREAHMQSALNGGAWTGLWT